jgi:Holliday junction resolvasome RuvABC endonuclease subunit
MLVIDDKYKHFRLVSIDPGLNNIGVAVFDIELDKDGFKMRRISAQTLKEGNVVDDICYDSEIDEERSYKRARMVSALMKVIRTADPSMVICESPFFDRTKPSSFAVLVEVMMAIQDSVHMYNSRIRFSIFAPQLVKKTLGVAGIKGKEIVREAMEKQTALLNVLVEELASLDEHAIDAMAIGYTFLLKYFKEQEQ